jgi:hypothetical protein
LFRFAGIQALLGSFGDARLDEIVQELVVERGFGLGDRDLEEKDRDPRSQECENGEADGFDIVYARTVPEKSLKVKF